MNKKDIYRCLYIYAYVCMYSSYMNMRAIYKGYIYLYTHTHTYICSVFSRIMFDLQFLLAKWPWNIWKRNTNREAWEVICRNTQFLEQPMEPPASTLPGFWPWSPFLHHISQKHYLWFWKWLGVGEETMKNNELEKLRCQVQMPSLGFSKTLYIMHSYFNSVFSWGTVSIGLACEHVYEAG